MEIIFETQSVEQTENWGHPWASFFEGDFLLSQEI